jgi:hypothetical protein
MSPEIKETSRENELTKIDGEAIDKDRTATLWNRLLEHTTPRGKLPPRGTPQRLVIDLATRSTTPGKLISPTIVPAGLITHDLLAFLRGYAQSLHAARTELKLHTVATAPDGCLASLRQTSLLGWCQENAPIPVDPLTSIFIYYETAGEMSKLHFDTSFEWEFNLLICLERERSPVPGGTATYFVEEEGRSHGYDLSPGEAVWFHSRQTPHGRTPLIEGEKVVLFSVGFRSGGR